MIGKQILIFRKKEGLSQEELAAKIGVSRQTISNWELEETMPDLKQAKLLAQEFNVSLDELTGNKNVLLEKVCVTEKNSNVIIKLVKVSGVTIGVLTFLVLVILVSMWYFGQIQDYKVTASGYGEGKICYYNNELTEYLVMKYNASNELVMEFDDDDIKSKFDTKKYKEPEDMVNDIVEYIENNGGTCLKEKESK